MLIPILWKQLFVGTRFFCFHARLNGSVRQHGTEKVTSIFDFSSREAWFGAACSPGSVAQQPISYDSEAGYWVKVFEAAGVSADKLTHIGRYGMVDLASRTRVDPSNHLGFAKKNEEKGVKHSSSALKKVYEGDRPDIVMMLIAAGWPDAVAQALANM